jgi:hypothetical protein
MVIGSLLWKIKNIFKKCKFCYDGEFYPYYGLAPHQTTYSVFEHKESEIKTVYIDKLYWPENFVESRDEPGFGMYFCPNKKCVNHRPW